MFCDIYRRSKNQAGQLGSAYMTKPLKSLPKMSSSAQAAKTEMSAPKFGVSWIDWSPDGNLLAVREESQPRCLWIWHALEAQLCALLVQMDGIVCARWRPTVEPSGQSDSNFGISTPVLAFVCNSSRVYFWTPSRSSWADLPALKMTSKPTPSSKSATGTFKSQKARSVSSAASTLSAMTGGGASGGGDFVQLNAVGLKWTGDGKRLIVLGKDRFCSCDITFKEDDGSVEINVDEDGEFANSVDH
jgi:hypothetical protein